MSEKRQTKKEATVVDSDNDASDSPTESDNPYPSHPECKCCEHKEYIKELFNSKGNIKEKLSFYNGFKLRILAKKYSVKNYQDMGKKELVSALSKKAVDSDFPINFK